MEKQFYLAFDMESKMYLIRCETEDGVDTIVESFHNLQIARNTVMERNRREQDALNERELLKAGE